MIEPLSHRTLRGHIRYLSQKPDLFGRERGDESFIITRHGDGAMTVRAHCRIREPAPTVLRDVVYSTDAGQRPLDCHVRLTVADRFMGSGWFRFALDEVGNGSVECESYGPSIGRLSQRVDTDGPIDGFGTHPVIGDAQLCRLIDRSNGPVRQRIRVFVPSPDHRGATPPQLSEVSIGLEYVGDDTVSVEAGEFDCLHFRFVDDVGPGMGGKQHPDYDVWVTQDNFILVQGMVGGDMANRYELILLQDEPAGG